MIRENKMLTSVKVIRYLWTVEEDLPRPLPGGGGVLLENLGRGVLPASQTLTLFMGFFLPYLSPDQKFDT